MLKTCPKCKIEKNLNEFTKDRNKLSGHSSYCKKCNCDKVKQHYANRSSEYKKIQIEQKSKARTKRFEVINIIRAKYGCQICNEKEPVCLDFHHVDQKTKISEISALTIRNNKQKLFNEINKCVVLCRNCHAKVHKKLIDLPKNYSICTESLQDYKYILMPE
jgi:hypothetical protein